MRKTRIGDVYSVQFKDKCRFFQHVCNDASQLNSDVIRVFGLVLDAGAVVGVPEIVASPVDFHTHVSISLGSKLKIWGFVGHAKVLGGVDTVFRTSEDYGIPSAMTSKRWGVWRVNEPINWVGRLPPELQNSEIGIVVTPHDLVDRLSTGKYRFFFPEPA